MAETRWAVARAKKNLIPSCDMGADFDYVPLDMGSSLAVFKPWVKSRSDGLLSTWFGTPRIFLILSTYIKGHGKSLPEPSFLL
jgi:hypothetical protein